MIFIGRGQAQSLMEVSDSCDDMLCEGLDPAAARLDRGRKFVTLWLNQ
jgi:hypothetical protein